MTGQSIRESYSKEFLGSAILQLSTLQGGWGEWVATDNARNDGHKDLPVYNSFGVNHTPVVIFFVRCTPMPKNTGDYRQGSM